MKVTEAMKTGYMIIKKAQPLSEQDHRKHCEDNAERFNNTHCLIKSKERSIDVKIHVN